MWSLTGCLVITVAADPMRVIAARGTHLRYVWATVEDASIYPTMVGVFLQVAGNVAERDWLWAGISLATSLYYVHLLARFRRDNDDDWFNSGGPCRALGRLTPDAARRHTAHNWLAAIVERLYQSRAWSTVVTVRATVARMRHVLGYSLGQLRSSPACWSHDRHSQAPHAGRA